MLWGKEGDIVVRLFGASLFLLQFPSEATCNWVLESGPWHIQQQVMFVRKWKPGMKVQALPLTKLPLWVELWNVPLEMFNPKGLSYIASFIGKPLYMDRFTAMKEKLAFAKVCIEIEAGKAIPTVILVDLGNKVIEVEVYTPWMPYVCNHCEVFGHTDRQCAKQKKHTSTMQWKPKSNMSMQQEKGEETSIIRDKELMGEEKQPSSVEMNPSDDKGQCSDQGQLDDIQGKAKESMQEVLDKSETVDKGGMVSESMRGISACQNQFDALASGDIGSIVNDVCNEQAEDHVEMQSPRQPRAAELGAPEAWKQLAKQERKGRGSKKDRGKRQLGQSIPQGGKFSCNTVK